MNRLFYSLIWKSNATLSLILIIQRIEDGGEKFKEVIAYIRKITGCNALAQVLYQVMCQNVTGTRVQKVLIPFFITI